MVSLYIIEAYLNNYIDSLNFSTLNRLESIDLILTTCKLLIEYLNENLLEFCYSDKNEELHNNILELYLLNFEDNFNREIYNHDDLKNDLLNTIVISNNLIYNFVIPPRSYKSSFIRIKQTKYKKKHLRKKINYLKNIKQPEQRTNEWYIFRHKTLTASNIWKVFGSESTQNQLIYEKCKPLTITENTITTHVNTQTPFHWGHKYEPLSVLYYEYFYNTKIEDFGCIPHSEYNYIAASPDGINCLETSDRYGRMLEIKNIVNRDITGIPKMEYWIQMQIQMETCRLNECDFLETRFIEYETYDDYLNDPDFQHQSTFDQSTNKYRGKILHFEKDGIPMYEYHMFGLTLDEIDRWENEIMNKYKHLTWIQTIYWKLSEISCILVLRNKIWFEKAQPYIEILWKIIEKERGGDYQHRAPKRKIKQNTITDISNNEIIHKCLINV